MYPSIVDMNENESSKCLRMLELDAYANILAALRAQGPPSNEKLKLLKDIGTALRIPQERCKAEIRKVILDERLNTIAYFSCGQLETAEEWIKEGRRLISLMPRVAPQTIYSAIADEVADAVSISNEHLPLPALTDQKRSTPISQVQQSVPETSKSQQYKTPDFKNEENKKRKLPFGIENSTLAQHLIAPSKISRIQQIYRQKVKAKVKEQQLQTKIKQEQEQDLRQLQQQPKLFQQQHFQSKTQKLPLTIQSPTTSNPKINILQNISITPPHKGEETIEQIKNEVNSFAAQKTEPPRTSPQPGCSNENQAPKQHKQTVVNIKPNSTITYKHVSSPGPSSDLKSLKVCPTRKTITKPGQKLIIVSNAQSIATSSILQRTLTIPFVKNISVKNFDKFKIVSTSANTNLQLTSLSTNATTFTTNSTKHKVVTVRTNPTTKKMIPLAHLQALNAKGSIKMLPVGGKILTKTSTTGTAPVYIVNSSGIQPATTKNTSCSSVVMTCRSQEVEKKMEEMESECLENEASEDTNDSDVNKSSVLADILKASGVIAPDNDNDVEAQIKQFAIIPQSSEVTQEDFETDANRTEEYQEEDVETSQNAEEQLLEDKDVDTIRLLKDLEGEDSSETVIGNLDPGTGEYTVETAQCEEQETETLESVTNEAFSLEVQKTVNMPDINVN